MHIYNVSVKIRSFPFSYMPVLILVIRQFGLITIELHFLPSKYLKHRRVSCFHILIAHFHTAYPLFYLCRKFGHYSSKWDIM